VSAALGKGCFALGKAFAECNTQQRGSVKLLDGKAFVCRVLNPVHSAKYLPGAAHALGKYLTPSVKVTAIFFIFFAECNTRQRNIF
jgi:hypothetical protein